MNKTSKKAMRMASIAAAAALALCCGCASITTTKPGACNGIAIKGANGAPSEMVWIETGGEYMFFSLPIASGAFRWNDTTQKLETYTAWFEDCVGITELQAALLKYAESRNCDLADVTIHDADTSYAGPSYEGAVGALFGSSSMGMSAMLIPRQPADIQ